MYSVTAGMIGVAALLLPFVVDWLIDASAPKRTSKPQDSAERGWYPPLVPGDGESVWESWDEWNKAHPDEPPHEQ